MFAFGRTDYPLGKQAIISYRGAHFPYAVALKRLLEETKQCEQAIVFPANSLCAPGELLLPYEYIELMEVILDYLARCDSFVYLATSDYEDSYFTQAEVLQWRRFKPKPLVIPARMDRSGSIHVNGPQSLEELPQSSKKMWATISVQINKNLRGHLSPASAWGRYARSCFLVPCEQCGEHFLVTKKTVDASLRGEFKVFCPHCNFGQVQFAEGSSIGNYYRKPISLRMQLSPNQRAQMRVLGADEILSLLVDNEAPSAMPVVSFDGKVPWKETTTALVCYGVLAGVAAAALGVASLLSNEEAEKN